MRYTLNATSIGKVLRKSTFNRGRTKALTKRSSSVSLIFRISAKNRCRSAVSSFIYCVRTLRMKSSSSICAPCQLGNTSGLASSLGIGDGAGVGGEAGKFSALLSERVRGFSTRMMPSSSTAGVVWACSGEWTKGGESGATGPPTMEVGWRVRTGRASAGPVDGAGPSGLECGEGVRGGLEEDVRRWKRLPDAVKVGTSRERPRPRVAAAAEEEDDDDDAAEDSAEVGMGICSSGGPGLAIVTGRGCGEEEKADA